MFDLVIIDANVIIHLYDSGRIDLIKKYCSNIFIHEEVLRELKLILKNKYEQFLLPFDDLLNFIFEEDLPVDDNYYDYIDQVEENTFLFAEDNKNGLGEMYSFAYAKIYGIKFLLTNDLKKDGPYHYLLKNNTSVSPVNVYELLIIDVIKENKVENIYTIIDNYDIAINSKRINAKYKITKFLERFDHDKNFQNLFLDTEKNIINTKLKS